MNMMNTNVYIFQNLRTGDVKIGFTSDINARISGIKSGAGADIALIRVMGGGRETERWMHKRFAHLRISGEWFSYHDDMLSVVPPDEIPVVKQVTVRRDVKLTISEKVRLVERLATDIGVGPKSELLMLVSELTVDQAAEVLEKIKSQPRRPEEASTYEAVTGRLI